MEYQKLPYEQYFIDQSQGSRGGTPRVSITYKETVYLHKDHEHTIYHCVFWDSSRQVLQIYFKETSDDSEWRANFEFSSKYYDRFEYDGKMIQLKTAGGWGDMYSCIKHRIRNSVKYYRAKYGKNIEVEIIGWSLGSALAQLCCQDLYFNFNIKSHVFTYGSVKPWKGSDSVMKKYLSECYKECYNFKNREDIVGYMVCLPGYFSLRKIRLKASSSKFWIFNLFKPLIYHTNYWNPDLYKEID